MMVYAHLEKHHEIILKAKELGVEKVDFKFDNEGLKLWKVEENNNLGGEKAKAIFLDRDGVLNEDVHLLHKKEDIRILPNVEKALSKFKEAGYKLISVTNQPTVARGWIDEPGVKSLNKEINSRIGNLVDEFYFCPHHPNADLPGYRQSCECRKPEPGMLLQAADDFNIDLSKSWIIGDQLSDIAAGKSAGCRTILVKSDKSSEVIESGKEWNMNVKADYEVEGIFEASTFLTGKKNIKSGKIKKALILSAGVGNRMGEFTKTIPKVMLELKGKPLLQHNIEKLRDYGVEEICINLHSFPKQIKEFFGDGSRFGVKIHYNFEPELMGTAGVLHGFKEILDEDFFMLDGDVVGEVDIEKWAEFHKQKNSDVTLIVHPSSHPEDSDIVQLDESQRITNLYHKPGHREFGILGNSGWRIVSPKVFDYLEKGNSDFINGLCMKLNQTELKLYVYNTNELLMDVGTPERFEKMERLLEN